MMFPFHGHALQKPTFLPCLAAALLLSLMAALPAVSQMQMAASPGGDQIIIEDAPEMQVIAFAKTVIIRKHAKEVFVWGGDIIVEGRVDGDVAAIGGSVIQKESAYIGGAVIVIGGSYRPESQSPLRAEGKETVMFGAFEDELREMARNPSQIFAPSLTVAFLAQRLLSILFWFVVTFVVATLAPGAVGRSIERFRVSTLKVFLLGSVGFLVTTIGTILGIGFFPEYLSVVIGLMAFALLMMAYGFGRVVLQVSAGKFLGRKLNFSKGKSEAVAILFGVVIWTILLSIPYIWTLALLTLFAAGIGLILTARAPRSRIAT
jgi:hypothetical protein